jgi:DNA-directed RNA polymerase subunit M/transcription elongation factor TFIIS
MMTFCPHCGYRLQVPLINGMTGCHNCRRIVDASPTNRLLSLAWAVRRQNITEPESLVYRHGADAADAEFVIDAAYMESMSHEEFVLHLKETKYADRPKTRLDRAS